MKKAKFALTAVAVLAIVGGVLASKAKGNHLICYIKNSGFPSDCDLQVFIFDKGTVSTPGSNLFCDASPHIGCCTNPVTFYYAP